jgi:crotonobetainyl-CoA:carnitine CoA-transferase CaiB-like acyl-CoA transferase
MGALDGLSVVDFSWGRAGPFASGQLADHGADVVKVEPPGGDPFAPFVTRAAYDRGKRSIVVDLAMAEGLEIALRLVDGADVVLESWRPGVAERLGLGFTELSERCPRLVYCSITGAGTEGDDVDHAGYESLVAARTGLMADRLQPDGEPVYPGVPLAGMGAGLLAVIGIGAALVARESTGRGQLVETSMVDGVLAFMTMFWETLENLPDASAPSALAPSRRLLVGSFICGDGEYLGVHTGANGSHARLMTAMGLADRVPPAPGNREKTVPLNPEEQEIVVREVPKLFASQPRAYWEQRLLAADVTAIPIHRPTEVFDEAQVAHNDATVRVRDVELGELEQVGVAARLSDTPGAVRSGAPPPGAHSNEILHALGYTDSAIDALRRAAIVS